MIGGLQGRSPWSAFDFDMPLRFQILETQEKSVEARIVVKQPNDFELELIQGLA